MSERLRTIITDTIQMMIVTATFVFLMWDKTDDAMSDHEFQMLRYMVMYWILWIIGSFMSWGLDILGRWFFRKR